MRLWHIMAAVGYCGGLLALLQTSYRTNYFLTFLLFLVVEGPIIWFGVQWIWGTPYRRLLYWIGKQILFRDMIGPIFRDARLGRRMTQDEMASQLKISLKDLERIERGEARPSLEVMNLLLDLIR